MVGKKKYDVEVRVKVSTELRDVLKQAAKDLELTDSDIMRMLLKVLKTKGTSILS